MSVSRSLLDIADSMLYVSALLGDQPRRIDRVIHYFGETPAFLTAASGVAAEREVVARAG